MTYHSEEEFLKNYNSDEFEKLSMTTDILVFSVSDEPSTNYRKTSRKHMSILLVKRSDYPFKDKWCLPGGFLDISESLDECSKRVLKKKTNVSDIYLEQLYTFGAVNRDPRMRIVSTAYMALIDKRMLGMTLTEDASWFNVFYEETDKFVQVFLDNGEEELNFKLEKKCMEQTSGKWQYVVTDNEYLAFDHPLVIWDGIERLKNKVNYTDVVFNLMPEYFTLGELQQVYEVILNKKLLDPAFRRIIADKVVKTNKVKTGGGHRPSALFKYKSN